MKLNKVYPQEKTLQLIIVSLLVLVIISFTVVGNLVAKYSVGADVDEVARVAKFNIIEEGITSIDIGTKKFKPGYSIAQPIKIKNDSEVAVRYTLTVSSTGNLPLDLAIVDHNQLIVSEKLPPNSDEIEYNLLISWPEEITDPAYSSMVDSIKLLLAVEQLD